MKLENPEFVSARNLASGSIRLKNPEESKTRNLDFLAYYVYNSTGLRDDLINCYHSLVTWGFSIPPFTNITQWATEDAHTRLIKEFEVNRANYAYQTDGLVIKMNSHRLIKELGATSHHPKSMIAYKFESEFSETSLINIEWQVSSTGRINPVGILTPVQIGDVTVARVSLHNLDNIRQLNLKINDSVIISRANDVIPFLKEAVRTDDSIDIQIPECCPACGSTVTNADNTFLYCMNNKCKAVLKEKVLRFCGILGIKGIGDAIAEGIATNLGIKDTDYYYLLTCSEEFLSAMAGSWIVGAKIFKELEKAKENFTQEKALAALFIEGIGKTASEKIIAKYAFKDLCAKGTGCYTSIDGIGEILAYNIVTYFYTSDVNAYDFFLKYVKEGKVVAVTTSNSLLGKTFCVTGVHPVGRTELEKLIKDNSGTLGSVSKNLNFLVAGEKAGSKLMKAQSAGVKVITYSELLEMTGK